MWAWLVGSVWAVPQCCPAVLIGVEAVGGRGLWGVWAWPLCGRGFGCSVGAWSDVGVACGFVGGATAVLIGETAVGGRGLCGRGFVCTMGAWPDVGVACGCGRDHNGAHWRESGRWAWLVGMWAWPLCGRGFGCSVGVWSDVGVVCGCGGGATAVLIGEKAVGGRGLWVCGRGLCGCGLRCNVGAWSGVAWAWLSVCGRGLIVPI